MGITLRPGGAGEQCGFFLFAVLNLASVKVKGVKDSYQPVLYSGFEACTAKAERAAGQLLIQLA